MFSALDVALRVAAALDAIGCEYFVGGSVASSLQGEPRATNDIDIVVAMMPHRVRQFAEELGADFEVDQDMLRDALVQGRCANIFYLPSFLALAKLLDSPVASYPSSRVVACSPESRRRLFHSCRLFRKLSSRQAFWKGKKIVKITTNLVSIAAHVACLSNRFREFHA